MNGYPTKRCALLSTDCEPFLELILSVADAVQSKVVTASWDGLIKLWVRAAAVLMLLWCECLRPFGIGLIAIQLPIDCVLLDCVML